MIKNGLFTSESVSEGHPDKMCDQISDGVLDAIFKTDPNARVACECATTTGLVLVTGEITTTTYVDIPKITRDIIREIGYSGINAGFDADDCSVITAINRQSPDIAGAVDEAWEMRSSQSNVADLDEQFDKVGAGDQGLMFGYACDETDELMPLPIVLAHKLTQKVSEVRKNGKVPYLRPDNKSQVTVEYQDGKPIRIDTIVISTQHDDRVHGHDDNSSILKQLREDLIPLVINEVVPQDLMTSETRILINPSGRFVIGGPVGDAGLTGRKIIVDTYGGYAHHGGGAFSGKDPTKVDRSASYAARYVAKNLVAAGLAEHCEVQLSYAIGVARPVSVMVNTFGTAKIPEERMLELIHDNFELRPAGIIHTLDLRRPIYRQTAAYGHFGRTDLDLPWERLDKVEILKKALL